MEWLIVHDDEMRKCKRDVQCYLNLQRGNLERRCIQKRDDMFNIHKHPQRFRSSGGCKHVPEKLLVNDTLIMDPETLPSTWVNHFESGGKSQALSNDFLNDDCLFKSSGS